MEKVVAPKVYFGTCIALLALLALTRVIAYVDLGPFNLIVALAVAITKAILIALLFMHIKGSSRVLHLAAVAGVIWLLFLISLTLGDYLTSGWVPLNRIEQQQSAQADPSRMRTRKRLRGGRI